MSSQPVTSARPPTSVVVLSAALILMACVPATIARAALAGIPGDSDGSVFNHLLFAVPAFALAAFFVAYALRAAGGRAPWFAAAGVLLPFAWLPSALSWPGFAELLLTLAVLTGAVVCAVRALEQTDAEGARAGVPRPGVPRRPKF